MSNNQDNGNAAAMRAALEYVIQWREDCISEEGADNVDDMIAIVQTALSASARNCDVGTAQEQSERFGKLCGKYYNEEETCNEKCPLASLPIIHGFPRCQAYWAQTPYTAEEGGAE